jgi:hypothetical protein
MQVSGCYLPSSAYLLLLGNAAFTLRPFCVALGRLWCEHTYPRWDAHTMPICTCNTSVLAHRLLSWGRSSNLRPFALPRPDALSPLPTAPPYAVWPLVSADTSLKPET